ncbi:glycine cleavage T C-terminal barrel domain-containing protein [Vreelandella azerica]|uniref:glycine cleavage T C-terminal barrel domain-containing protein n=1 Tax=Vreelandella azerica TaxID=2732867 RepID=UPI001F239E63|nr:glycine cleavage T C-terminal barrel domain-containing protein [Halomonas azerica]
MSWAVNRKKPFFVGRRAVDILESQPAKRRLVAFQLPASSAQPLEGHLVLDGPDITGNVTSCEYSATLESIIGLAYANPDKSPAARLPSVSKVVQKSTPRSSSDLSTMPRTADRRCNHGDSTRGSCSQAHAALPPSSGPLRK